MEPLIRPATEQDLQRIADLYTTSFPEHIMVHRGILNNPKYLTQKISDPEQQWVVAEVNNEILGVAALAIAHPVGLGEIERVCVARPFRGNGIASAICSYLTRKAEEEGLGFVEAFARGNEPAMQRTFQKLGFQVFGIAPRFEVMHGDSVVRELFVHFGKVLRPETVDYEGATFIPGVAQADLALNLAKYV